MASPSSPPHNPEIEEALIGRLLREPALCADVSATLLEPAHFHLAAHRLLYEAIIESFYADEPIEPLVIGELHAKRLGRAWALDERTAVQRVVEIADTRVAGDPVEHAKLIKRDADYRALLKIARDIEDRVASEKQSPEEIAGITSQAATGVATSAVMVTQELVSFEDVGKQFVRDMLMAQAAREQGIELGAKFGLKAIDEAMHGLRGGELAICGGEPGVGKSAVWWKGGLNFAESQLKAPNPVGTLILSLEMNATPSAQRFASMLAGLNGTDIREGRVNARQLEGTVAAWRQLSGVPLWLNYAPTLKASQLRAVISEAIRRHNVGLVILDHFRMWDLDERLPNKNDEDEEKVRFLKEQICSSLNVAMVCLAHTRKPDPSSNGRPKMSDLRGSYQVAAHSDFVGFVFRPWMYASDAEREAGEIADTDAEMLWPKNRHGEPRDWPFFFDPRRMFIAD